MKNTAVKCYKRRMSHDKSGLARIIDAVSLRILALTLGYFWFIEMGTPSYIAILLSIIVTVILSIALKLVSDIRLERFIVNERIRLAAIMHKSKLAVIPYQDFVKVCHEAGATMDMDKCLIYPIQRINAVNADTVLTAYRVAMRWGYKQLAVFSASDFSKDCQEFVSKVENVDIKLVPPDTLTAYLIKQDMLTDVEIDAMIVDEYEKASKTRKKNRREVLSKSRVKPYVILGTVLILLSFLLKYSIFYRLIAGFCFSAALWISLLSKNRSADII